MSVWVDFEFGYLAQPRIPIRITNPETGQSISFDGLIDTGAEVTLLDDEIAQRIGLVDTPEFTVQITGIADATLSASIHPVELALLEEDDLRVSIRVAFAENHARRLGNLIGLDVLEHFDFALAHADRLGYLGRR